MKRETVQQLMKEMKKVWSGGYNYEMRSRELDRETREVLKMRNHTELMEYLLYKFPKWHRRRQRFVNYAIARWYNYQSSTFAESVFAEYPNVVKSTKKEDREKHIDFYIDGVPFDLKNTTYPAGFPHPVEYAKRNQKDLIQYLYENQSRYANQTYVNKLFLTMYSSYRPNWTLKAELFRIERAIKRWMNYYKLDKMTVKLGDNIKVKSDIIWLVE